MDGFWLGFWGGAVFSVSYIATFTLVDTGIVSQPAWIP